MKTYASCLTALALCSLLCGCALLSPSTPAPSQTHPKEISICLDDVELTDVVRLFARISGANIIADPKQLHGRCTANLDNVPWHSALKIILSMHHLELVETPGENIYRIEPGPEHQRVYHYPAYAASTSSGTSSPGWPIRMLLTILVIIGASCTVCYLRKFIIFLAGWLKTLQWIRIARALLGSAWYVILTVFYSIVTCFYLAARTLRARDLLKAHSLWVTLVVAALASLFLLAVILRLKKRWKQKLSRRAIWTARILFVLPALAMIIDSPQPKRIYTWDDIAHDSPDADASAMLLDRVLSKGVMTTRAPEGLWDLDTSATGILAGAELIEMMWDSASDDRLLISELDRYEVVAQQIDPEDCDWDTPLPSHVPLRDVGYAYWYHSLLRCAQGRHEEGIAELAEIHSFATKLAAGSRHLVTKMIAVAMLSRSIETAHLIIQETDCSESDLKALQAVFTPIDRESASIVKPIITQALLYNTAFTRDDFKPRFLHFFKNELRPIQTSSASVPVAAPEPAGTLVVHEEDGTVTEIKNEWPAPEPPKEEPAPVEDTLPEPGFRERVASRLLAFLFYNPNRTVRDFERVYSIIIDSARSAWPDRDATRDLVNLQIARPDILNLGGWLILGLSTPSYTSCHQTCSEILIKSDLLALTLSDKLGGDLELPDYQTGRWYQRDPETGARFSAGPDGIPGNEDDIHLGDDL